MTKADDIGRREMCPAQAGWFHYWKRRQYGKPLLGYVQSSDIIWHIFQKFLRILGRKGAPEGGTVMNAKRKRESSSWAALWQLTGWEVVWPRMNFANHFSESLRGTFKVLDTECDKESQSGRTASSSLSWFCWNHGTSFWFTALWQWHHCLIAQDSLPGTRLYPMWPCLVSVCLIIFCLFH